MLSEAPPCSELLTTSLTWPECVEVKALTSSGMMAPAAVPQVMMRLSFHHQSPAPGPVPMVGMRNLEATKVRTTETIEVRTTRLVRGCSKLNLLALPYLALEKASLMK